MPDHVLSLFADNAIQHKNNSFFIPFFTFRAWLNRENRKKSSNTWIIVYF